MTQQISATVCLPSMFVSTELVRLIRAPEPSEVPIFCSAVSTPDSAATAAALWDPWPDQDGFGAAALVPEEGLNAEDNAANADAL